MWIIRPVIVILEAQIDALHRRAVSRGITPAVRSERQYCAADPEKECKDLDD